MTHQSFWWEHLTLGTCYYPEHWDKSLWESDLDRMLQAGITLIRIAEFSWNKVEPEEGVFTFDFFDAFLDLCAQKGMQVVFGTPTATPPAWLTEQHPEVLNASREGVIYRHGARRHYNYNSPVYREYVRRIVEKEAEHYGPHPAIVGWQIDNELNCEVDEFYSEADDTAFRAFVQRTYGTLEALNAAWGTAFWNQTYTSWEQVHVLRPVLNTGYNPHQHLDYIRFISESVLDFCALQERIIRKYCKEGDFITTNGLFRNMDNHRMQRKILDVYVYDSYPNFAYLLDQGAYRPDELKDRSWSKNLTQVRSVCPHFGIMEQQSGANGWTTRMEAPSPRPGQLTLWALQSVAHGADMVSFFRWRTCTVGTEMYWHGILDYDNRDNRKLAEVRSFGQMLKKLDALCGADHVAAFALIQDYENEWDCRVDNWHRRVVQASEQEIFAASQYLHTPNDVVYLESEEVGAASQAAKEQGELSAKEQRHISAKEQRKLSAKEQGEFSAEELEQIEEVVKELSRYPVALYPHPIILSPGRAQILRRYVEQGGTLILGCRSGYKDLNGHCVMLPQPGLLQDLTGSDVRDFSFASPAEEPITAGFTMEKETLPHEAPMQDASTQNVLTQKKEHVRPGIPMPVFNDVLETTEGGRVLAVYENGYFAGQAAAVEKKTGAGRVIHVGSTFCRENLELLFDYTKIREPFAADLEAPREIELVGRSKGGQTWLFTLNYEARPVSITLKRPMTDLLSGKTAEGSVTLPPFGAAVWKREG